jgi:hypothetical protein
VTAVLPSGLNVQVLGYFEGTIDLFHLPGGNPEEVYKAGVKLKARVLYEINATSPPRFALSLLEHILSLVAPGLTAGYDDSSQPLSLLADNYPVGTVLEAVKVSRVEPERGLVLEVSDNVTGYAHVRLRSSLALERANWRTDLTNIGRSCSQPFQFFRALASFDYPPCSSDGLSPVRWTASALITAIGP